MSTPLEKDFLELCRIGALDTGGVTRLALAREDLEARQWLIQRMEEADLCVTVDAAGNIRGRLPGREELAPVMMGSHLDTVPQGGHYDGTVGVLAALEAVRRIRDRGRPTRRPLEVVNFTCEESSRFGMAALGSRAMAGTLEPGALKRLTDDQGLTAWDCLAMAGYRPGEIRSAALPRGAVHAFVELHIEQGPVLDAGGFPIGIVTSIAAPTRFKVVIQGRSSHSGTTPMNMRRDALAGAGELILGIERIAAREAGAFTVGTVGYTHALPGSMNVVPGRVEVGIDIRDIDAGDKDRAVTAVRSLMGGIAEKRGLTLSIDQLCHDRPVPLCGRIIQCLERSARNLGLGSLRLPSGAGHDAMNMAAVTETGMIFIPSRDGISHNPEEHTPMNAIHAGCEVLLNAVLELAEE